MTEDTNSDEQLQNASDAGDADGPVSYAGRKNSNQKIYPGIFKQNEDIATTPIIADDIGEPHNNHENGNAMNILFLDMHAESKNKNASDFPDLNVLAN